MNSSSGGKLKVAIQTSDVIVVDGQIMNLYHILKKLDCIERTHVRKGKFSRASILIDRSVFEAIKMYERNNGYAGLALIEYLRKLFAK